MAVDPPQAASTGANPFASPSTQQPQQPAGAGGNGGTGTGGATQGFRDAAAAIDRRRDSFGREAAQGNAYQDEFFALNDANERLAIARAAYEISTGSRQADIRALKGVAQGWNQV